MKRLLHRLGRYLSGVRTHYLLDRSFGWGRWEALCRAVRGIQEPCYPESKRRNP